MQFRVWIVLYASMKASMARLLLVRRKLEMQIGLGGLAVLDLQLPEVSAMRPAEDEGNGEGQTTAESVLLAYGW